MLRWRNVKRKRVIFGYLHAMNAFTDVRRLISCVGNSFIAENYCFDCMRIPHSNPDIVEIQRGRGS